MRSFAILVLALAACGGKSSTDPGIGDNPGTGTGTLVVEGNVRADAQLSNAQKDTEFTAAFDVRVTLNGQSVTTGTVSVTSSTGSFDLAFNGDRNHWTGTSPNYDEVYILDVDDGTDTIVGVRVDGPDIHTFDAPTAGESVDSTMPLDIKWSAHQTADEAALETDQLDPVAIDDTHDFTLAAGTLRAEKDQARTDTIRITRSNQIVPEGAAAGSTWSVSITNSIDVIVQPNPAL